MRIDLSVPAEQRTGISVYYNDYKRGLAVDCSKIRSSSGFRKNKPHPAKNFLEPRRMPEEGAALQRRVREAVRSYLNKTYHSVNTTGDTPKRPPLFHLPTDDEELEPTILHPSGDPIKEDDPVYRDKRKTSSTKSPQYRVRSATDYQVHKSGFDSHNTQSLEVNGTYALRPSSDIINERTSPLHLKGETKRDREQPLCIL